jgi:hypothetical protein
MDVQQLFSDVELRATHAAGVGVIFNGYPTYRVLHAAQCWSVERMDTKTEKFAGGSAERAQTWADAGTVRTGGKPAVWDAWLTSDEGFNERAGASAGFRAVCAVS